MRIMVLLLNRSEHLPQSFIEVMLLTWLTMFKQITYTRGSPRVFIMYTEKKGVTRLKAKIQQELKTSSFLKLGTVSGLLNSFTILSLMGVDLGSGVRARA